MSVKDTSPEVSSQTRSLDVRVLSIEVRSEAREADVPIVVVAYFHQLPVVATRAPRILTTAITMATPIFHATSCKGRPPPTAFGR